MASETDFIKYADQLERPFIISRVVTAHDSCKLAETRQLSGNKGHSQSCGPLKQVIQACTEHKGTKQAVDEKQKWRQEAVEQFSS